MNLSQIRTRITDHVDDTLADSIINNWINDIYHDIESDNDWIWLVTSATGTLTSSNSYTLSSTFSITNLAKIISVRDITSNENYTFVPYRERDEADVNDNYEYSISPDDATIYLYPVVSGDTLEIHYQREITELSSDSDEPLFHSMFHDILVYGVSAKYYERNLLFPEANREEAKYLNMLAKMRAWYERDTYDEIVRMQNFSEAKGLDFS